MVNLIPPGPFVNRQSVLQTGNVILAKWPTNAPAARQPLVIVRRSAVSARFVTVVEPVADGAELRAVRWSAAGTGPGVLTLKRATGSERLELR